MLKNRDGSCMDFAAAFRWIVNGALPNPLAEAIRSDFKPLAVLVDATDGAQSLQLTLAARDDEFGVDLVAHWDGVDE